MKKPKFSDVLYFASGLWAIIIGLNIITGIVKGLRK